MYAPEFEFVCDNCENIVHIAEQFVIDGHDDDGQYHKLYVCKKCHDKFHAWENEPEQPDDEIDWDDLPDDVKIWMSLNYL